jgi:protein SCO1/2
MNKSPRLGRLLPIHVRVITALLASAALDCDAIRAQSPNLNGYRIDQLIEEVGITPQLGNQLPLDLTFTDADGHRVQLESLLDDRPVILHLVYYQCPMLCQLSSDGLLRALDVLSLKPGQDFSVITLSFDPREGPEFSARARQVAMERFDRSAVEHGWTFLTGEEAEINSLCSAVGFRYKFDAEKKQYAHASGVFVLTSGGTISRFLSGVEYSPRDLRLALVEASAGKIGTARDQVMMLCYMYDPSAGKYGLAIMTVLRTAGGLTVVSLALAIGLMLRRERVLVHKTDASQSASANES